MANIFSARPLGRRGTTALAAIGLLIAGGGAGAVTVAMTRPTATMAPATPVAIRTLSQDGIATIRGRIAEVYGNHFILADGSGRALVDAGREGEGRFVVGQPLTVQGRYEDGFIHAAFLVDGAGKVTQVGPMGGPPHDGHGPDDRRGPHGPGPRDRMDRDGPDGDRAPPPPPPAPATGTVAGATAAQPVTTAPANPG